MHDEKNETKTSFNAFSLLLGHVIQFLQSNTKSICEVLSVIIHIMMINMKLMGILLTTPHSQCYNLYQIKTRVNNLSIRLEHIFLFLVQTQKSAHDFFLIDFFITIIDLKQTAFIHSKCDPCILHHIILLIDSMIFLFLQGIPSKLSSRM